MQQRKRPPGVMPAALEAEIRKLLEWKLLIATMETALNEFSAGRVIQPVRSICGTKAPPVRQTMVSSPVGTAIE
jgi:hypothetical protein